MSRTVYVPNNVGLTVYAKPQPHVTSPSWDVDTVELTDPGGIGEYSGTIGDGPHLVYKQTGPSPSSADKFFYVIAAVTGNATEEKQDQLLAGQEAISQSLTLRNQKIL